MGYPCKLGRLISFRVTDSKLFHCHRHSIASPFMKTVLICWPDLKVPGYERHAWKSASTKFLISRLVLISLQYAAFQTMSMQFSPTPSTPLEGPWVTKIQDCYILVGGGDRIRNMSPRISKDGRTCIEETITRKSWKEAKERKRWAWHCAKYLIKAYDSHWYLYYKDKLWLRVMECLVKEYY